MTAFSALPSPVTTTTSPLWMMLITSGRPASRLSSNGTDGWNWIRCPASTFSASAAGVSTTTTRPLSISATRSQSRSASSMKWLTRTMVTPRSRTPSIRSQVSRRACGSRPVVSSSSTATWGLPTRASAIDSRCFWPPDSLPNLVWRLSPSPSTSISPRQPAAVRPPEPLDAFDGRGFACAVRAEDPEDLALLYGEGNVVHRHGVRVRLVQVLHLYHCCHCPTSSCAPARYRQGRNWRAGRASPDHPGGRLNHTAGLVAESLHRSVDRPRPARGRAGRGSDREDGDDGAADLDFVAALQAL